MGQAEELLNSVTRNVQVHTHTLSDPDFYFTIDPTTREIDNASREKIVLMQYDHNSELFTFEIPRYIEGHDMTLCNRVRVHYNNIDGETEEEHPDVIELTDLEVSKYDPTKVVCTWLISRNATQVVGTLNFLIQYMCVTDDGTIVYEWHSDIFSNVYINKGRNYAEQVVNEYSDVLEQWYQRLFGEETNYVKSINGITPDENGNVTLDISTGSGGSGQNGATFIPAVDEEGNLSWSNDQNLENPPTVNLKGPKGDPGNDYVLTEDDIEQIASEASKQVSIDQVTPDQVVFPNGATTTYAIGKVTLTNGMGVLVEPGGTLADFFENFVDEKKPITTQPSVSLTVSQSSGCEVGTYVTPTYSASLNPGKYSYGPDTGITAKTWEITGTYGNTASTASGSFAQIQVNDDTEYKITATATYDAGAIPVTNTGNEYPAGQILASSKSATSGSVSGYRSSFYGTLDTKGELTSDVIRGLATKTDKALTNGDSFTITIPVGALRVVFAYPATLRDVTSVEDVNGLHAKITSSFANNKRIMGVNGANDYQAIDYKVYVLDFAIPNDTANEYIVII